MEGNNTQGAENSHPVISEEDEWFSLSDPPSDTDEDEEKERIAEAVKSKHPTPSTGKLPNDRKMQKQEPDMKL